MPLPKAGEQVTLTCNAWLGIILAAMSIGGIVYATATNVWGWVNLKDTKDATHDTYGPALDVVAEALRRQEETNRLGCAAGTYKKWYCDSWGLPYKTLNQEE